MKVMIGGILSPFIAPPLTPVEQWNAMFARKLAEATPSTIASISCPGAQLIRAHLREDGIMRSIMPPTKIES